MTEPGTPPEHRQATAIGRALIGLAGGGATAGGVLGGFANLSLFTRSFSQAADGERVFLTSMAFYYAIWIVFFMALLAAGISLMVAAIKGWSDDIVPGPSIYVMGTSLVIAGMFQLVFGNIELAAVTGLVGVVLMVVEYRSALL